MRTPSLIALACALLAGCNPAEPAGIDCSPACAAGFACVDGACVPSAVDASAPADLVQPTCTPPCAAPTPYCDGQHRCVACRADDDCPMGQICKTDGFAGAACIPGCAADARCDGGKKCCTGQCTDVAKDVNNCGACGMKCSANNATPACAGGACKPGECRKDFGDCDGDAANGCETNLHVDAKNCTACGMGCAFKNAIAGCANGCYLVACNFGFDDCNAEEKDGCETTVEADPNNCGGCGKKCPALANALAGCVAANCQIASCNQGFGDCDKDAKNGCELDLRGDANNCGKCGIVCPQGLICRNGGCTCQNCNIPNASATCVNMQCIFQSCNPGYTDCNNNLQDGCEAALLSDGKNCGACGKACAFNESCLNGACVPAVCQNGTVRLSISPGNDMVICDHPNDAICEQDAESECPPGWQLCTPKQHNNRRAGWNFQINGTAVGEIYCRGNGGNGGAGHYTFSGGNAGDPRALNCAYGSSRPTCVTGYGCNEKQVNALCCAPTATCGNGQVDHVEEECDDGNKDENDACLNNCTWRVPVDHGLGGAGC